MFRFKYMAVIAFSLAVMLLTAGFPLPAAAGSVGDAVTEVAKSIFDEPEFEFGPEDIDGHIINLHIAIGDIPEGHCFISVIGPVSSEMKKAVHADSVYFWESEGKKTTINGFEAYEFQSDRGAGVEMFLPEYVAAISVYNSGQVYRDRYGAGRKEVALEKARQIARLTLEGLERHKILGPASPQPEIEEIPKKDAGPDAASTPEVASAPGMVTGRPLDEPAPVCNVENIYAVDNGPTAPATFTVNSPHLVTYIRNYHWNYARGATPGTIGLKDRDGKIYGPWQAGGLPGQGGVPDAYWEVFPNVVIPAGTYTVIDSDPSTWSHNTGTGGVGMCLVNATPYFETDEVQAGGAAGGDSGGFPGSWSGEVSPAGVGSVGNIPGPKTVAEALVGVAVPGLIATVLGALSGLGGGGGGFAPAPGTFAPPAGGGPAPVAGGSFPGARTQGNTPVQEVGQLGRRRRGSDPAPIPAGPETGDRIDTTDMLGGVAITTRVQNAAADNELVIESADSPGTATGPETGDRIDTTDMLGGVAITTGVQNAAADNELVIESAAEAGDGMIIDTSAFDEPSSSETAGPDGESAAAPQDEPAYNAAGYDSEGYDKEGYDQEGYNTEGYDREGYNRDGYDVNGYDRDGYNQDGFDKEGFDREGFNEDGFDQAGFDRDGFDGEGFNKGGFDREGYGKSSYDRDGYNRDGYDVNGYGRDGYNRSGFDQEGFDRGGFNKDGFDQAGFNKDGFDKEGFNKDGLDREGFGKDGFDGEGFNKQGFDREGFDREGFNQDGFDREGYGKHGYDREGYNRDGYDVNGYDRKGYNRGGYDAAGFDKQGYDRDGFNKEGWDRDGYDRNGLNSDGYDREGYDSAGYDREGYDRDGYDRQGRQREGYDEHGYDRDGFNQDGYDRDGYDRQGFNYEGYNRGGYDPWGYDRRGYGKDGYHWSGYNADGYNKAGRHWSENPYEGDSPFNVHVRDPFDGGIVIIGENWKPTKPPLGEPYPRTVEKYGPKPWTTESAPEAGQPFAPQPQDPGINVPEGGESVPAVPGEQDMPETPAVPGEQDAPEMPASPGEQEGPEVPAAAGEQAGFPEGAQGPDAAGVPKHGDTITLVGKGDGKEYPLEYDAKTGEWKNLLTGGSVPNEELESYKNRFESWQEDLGEDLRRTRQEIEKMSQRQDAASKAIDQNMADWKRLEQMQKAADKYGIGTQGGPGDVDKAVQELKNDILAGREIDRDKMERINRVIGKRIKGETAADTGARWEQDPWYKDVGSALKANAEMAREVVTGEDAEGNISVLGMTARIMITAATGAGAAQAAMDGALTVAEAMHRIKDSIDKGESDFRAVTRAIGMVILEEQMGRFIGFAGGKISREMLERYPVLVNKAADFVEEALLKASKYNQAGSAAMGLISKEAADQAIKNIEKQIAELSTEMGEEGLEKAINKAIKKTGGSAADDAASAAGKAVKSASDSVDDAAGKAVKGAPDDAGDAAAQSINRGGRSADEVINDPAAVAKAQEKLQKSMKDFDRLPPAKQQDLIKNQAVYDEYRLQAEEKTWHVADKVQRGEKLTVEDALNMKSDPAAMRTLKNAENVDGLGAELGTGGARQVKSEFNELLNEKVYQPSYKNVQDHLSAKYNGAEIRVETVRTPGREYHPWDVNTDNDIIALWKVTGKDGTVDWVEVPRGEWEHVYYKSYAENTGFTLDKAIEKFPGESWGRMSKPKQLRRWAELHGETPTDVFHPEAARDFSTQRGAITMGEKPLRPGAAIAADGEGRLIDPEGLGLMEKNKVNNYWRKGDLGSRTEALENLKKTGDQYRNLERGYREMGYKIDDMPDNMKKALQVVENNKLSPAVRAARLQELGYDSPGDLAGKIGSRIGSLRAALKNK